MKDFADLYDKLDQTQSTNEKVAYLTAYFKNAPSADAAWALFFLAGHRIKRLISARLLFEWALEKSAVPTWLAEEAYASVGDTAETIALILRKGSAASSVLSLSTWMHERILPLQKLEVAEQKVQVMAFWDELTRQERFIFNKIITGSLRVGVSQLLTLRAISEAFEVPRESLAQQLMGKWEPTAIFFEGLRSKEKQVLNLNPYPFYLASPLEGDLTELGDPSKWLVEWKWDGIRAQGVTRQGMTALWSRGNELISNQFPEIIQALGTLPDGTVVDGELLGWKGNLPLPFSNLQKRLGRKNVSKKILEQVPILFMLYDVLEYGGRDLRSLSFTERRKVIDEIEKLDPHFLQSPAIVFQNWSDLKELWATSRERGTEGLMLKKADAPYGIGRQRGAWWKYKVAPMTIDAILLYAQAGQGRRANLYTDYTFGVWQGEELVPIAKAYSGLSDEEIVQLDRWIRTHTLEKFGPVRKVIPEQVFEIAFEGIQKSTRHKSGVALRFPRMARWRTDKPPKEIDTLESIKRDFL